MAQQQAIVAGGCFIIAILVTIQLLLKPDVIDRGVDENGVVHTGSVSNWRTTGITVASVAARGLRFFIVAGLLWHFGEPIRELIEKRLGLLFGLFCALLLGGFAAVKFLL